ncbi:hypothetical protein CC85DRAFT_93746 [Cutaneotrichosporon oleaginosum]|uniref:Uncharacterized protein n=1 Tax=Cutaneotrichosporon oleaginosum TaxID=879819 RepID=A0A0J0XMS8_9TREE|nr:uncharacterized protein CC85DRAFT_93746 [Cutaneotrichosporon oleaginosum]KLT42401.1 hypothetical protein CC85DRAFT_93746 [Cutaneotrichosporon oleaginosum]TXT04220.1 hypothetical protein COLE_07917 [Cutaneotrichosporon oleaginosum]
MMGVMGVMGTKRRREKQAATGQEMGSRIDPTCPSALSLQPPDFLMTLMYNVITHLALFRSFWQPPTPTLALVFFQHSTPRVSFNNIQQPCSSSLSSSLFISTASRSPSVHSQRLTSPTRYTTHSALYIPSHPQRSTIYASVFTTFPPPSPPCPRLVLPQPAAPLSLRVQLHTTPRPASHAHTHVRTLARSPRRPSTGRLDC